MPDTIRFVEEEIRKALPGAEYKIVLMENTEHSIVMRDGETEQTTRAASTSLVMDILADGRDGFFYSNNLSPDALRQLVRQAAETTMMLQPDPFRTLADPARYYRGDGEPLRNCDTALPSLAPGEKLDFVRLHHAEGLGTDPSLVSFQTRYSDRTHRARYLISNGFEGVEEASRCTLTSLATVDGTDGQHPMDGWGETRVFFRDMPVSGIAAEAIRRAKRKVGQRPAESGTYTMILEAPVVGSFLQPVLNAMNGQSLQQHQSFLEGKMGEQVLSPLISITDDPLTPGTRGAVHFDYDGTATSRRALFSQGRLRTYFIDTYYGRKLDMPPTTLCPHRLLMDTGGKSLQRLMADMGDAILVTDFNGGNCDPCTGLFSYGVEGLLIRGGEVAQPVSGMNISGNMLDVWRRAVDLADDTDPWDTGVFPSVAFADVNFGGR